MTSRPIATEYAPFFSGYVSLVPEDNVLAVLENQLADAARFAAGVSPERERFRYAPDKWSIREVFGHLIDSERVFGYRAFCISRGEKASLPPFDENAYVEGSRYDRQLLVDLLSEFTTVRQGNMAFLRQLDEQGWLLLGTASNNPVSVRALAFIMAGHVRHHFNVMRERYGVPPEA
jgi:hypothetical protein